MKKIYPILLLILISSTLYYCKQVDLESVTKVNLNSAVATGPTTATITATVVDLSNAQHGEYGLCYSSTNQTPTIADSKVTYTNYQKGKAVDNTLPGLLGSTTYYVRFYVMEGNQAVYSPAQTVTTTSYSLPTISTTAISDITQTTATSGGNVTADGGQTITERGICYSTSSNPTTANSKIVASGTTGSFVSNFTNLTANTTYYFAAYAINSVGTVYGSVLNFTTSSYSLPTISTTAISNITQTTASSGGNVTADGGLAITERGICISKTTNPTTAGTKIVATGTTGSFTSNITGLLVNSTYYVKAYAINSVGTSYGTEMSFIAKDPPITDYDGNIYTTVTIGTQVWLVENLKTTHYRNGDPIPNVTDNAAWSVLTTGAMAWYNNDKATYNATYGALYNWAAVNDARNICPVGFHVATDAEFTILSNFLGGDAAAGGKMKESGTTHWLSPNTAADNSSGFRGLPAGYRGDDGTFNYVGSNGDWWISTAYAASYAWRRGLNCYSAYWGRYDSGKLYGFSVRVLRD